MTTHATVHPHAGEIRSENIAWWQSTRAQQVGMIAVVLTLVGLGIWWFAFRPFLSTDDARVAAVLVRVAPAGVSGRALTVNVDVGSKVTKGEVLVELDHRLFEAQLERAKAKFDLASRELKRIQQLVAQHGLPQRDLDNAQANADSAEADMKVAEVNLENTYLKSPFDGVVVQKTAEVGNIIEAGQTTVTVADIDHAWIAANVEETDVGSVKVGQPVTVTVDEGGDLNGHIATVGAATAAEFALIPSDNGSGNFTKVVQRIPIKVALDEVPRTQHLRVGQSVEIKIRVRN